MNDRILSEKIAKNTFLLYARQIAIMLINLYMVRKVLSVLGDVDYGIYTLVAGVVTMFNVLSSSMSQACQRFFSFDLGKGDYARLNKSFSASLCIYAMIGLCMVILTESIGVWYLREILTIPEDRMNAVFFVYQASVVSLLFTMVSTPFIALVLAYEDMRLYAFISVFEAVLKLLFVFLLSFSKLDRLKLYSASLTVVSVIVALAYITACKWKYRQVRYTNEKDKPLLKELINFAGWNLFGALIFPLKIQGLNIVINQFFGAIIITARGIAVSVNSAVTSFYINFGNAVRPQIVKCYASGDEDGTIKIVFTSSKVTYLLMFAIMFPFIMEMDFILNVWLTNVPPYAVLFTQLTLVEALIESVSNPIIALVSSTGKIRLYQFIVGGIQLLNLPFAYLAILLYRNPVCVYVVAILLTICTLIARICILPRLTRFSAKDFLAKVMVRVIFASVVSIAPILAIKSFWGRNLLEYFIIYILFECITLLSFWGLAFDKIEKQVMLEVIKAKLGNFKDS